MRLLWLGALLPLVACGGETKQAAPTASASATANAPPAPVVEVEGLEVQSRGQAPAARRYRPEAGVEQLVTVAVARGSAMVGQNVKPTPASNLTFAVTCGEPTDGQLSCRYAVKRAGLQTGAVPDAMKKQIDAQLDKLIGFSGEVKVSDHGMVASVTPDEREDPVEKIAALGVADTVSKLFVPLPRAPIGIGAEWSFTREVKSDELLLSEVTRYSLKKIDGNKLEVEASVTHEPARKGQQVEYVKGVKLDVTGYEARGRARYQLRPDRVVPAAGEVEVLASMTLAKDGKNDKSLALLTRSTYATPKP